VTDDSSWNDLLAEDYVAKISKGASIFAQQIFYQQLRCGQNKTALENQQQRLQTL